MKARKHRTYRDVATLLGIHLIPHAMPDKMPTMNFLIHTECKGAVLRRLSVMK
jgi:hypothetical protein